MNSELSVHEVSWQLVIRNDTTLDSSRNSNRDLSLRVALEPVQVYIIIHGRTNVKCARGGFELNLSRPIVTVSSLQAITTVPVCNVLVGFTQRYSACERLILKLGRVVMNMNYQHTKKRFSRKRFSLRNEREIKGETWVKTHFSISFIKRNYQSPPSRWRKKFEPTFIRNHPLPVISFNTRIEETGVRCIRHVRCVIRTCTVTRDTGNYFPLFMTFRHELSAKVPHRSRIHFQKQFWQKNNSPLIFIHIYSRTPAAPLLVCRLPRI